MATPTSPQPRPNAGASQGKPDPASAPLGVPRPGDAPAAERRDRPGPDDRGGPPARKPDDAAAARSAPRAARPIAAILAALTLGLVLGGGAVALFGTKSDSGAAFAGVVDSTRYQAVILSNDKVYFGRITRVDDNFYRLDQAFFLRETRENADAEPVRSLLPVNREIHAPENTMLIRREQVVIIENLADRLTHSQRDPTSGEEVSDVR